MDRMNVKRDPRAEKQRDFRHAGHCRKAGCGLCHPEKKWRAYRKARRALSKIAMTQEDTNA